jgi:ribose transport system substrate-binding protein
LRHLHTKLFAVLIALALTAAACNGNDVADAPDAREADGEGRNIALLLRTRGFEFMVALDQGARETAEQAGANITVLDAQDDSANQIAQIEDLIARGIDGIAISANDSEELVPGIEMANDAGVPVVTVDGIVAGGDIASHVGFDNEAGGAMAAEFITDLLDNNGKVLHLQGAQGSYHAVGRGDGFNGSLGDGIEQLAFDTGWVDENALSITVDSFTANPDIDAVYTHTDGLVTGVLSGLQQVDAVGTPIVSIDGAPSALELIREGELLATIVQDPLEMGEVAIASLLAIIEGEDVPDETLLEPQLVTEENANDENLWGNQQF